MGLYYLIRFLLRSWQNILIIAMFFLAKNAAELLENTGINKHTIKLKRDKQLPFRPIHSLEPVKLEILKTYIKINLANGFIRPFKSSVGALILFDRKPDRSLRFCINYWGFNNITIKIDIRCLWLINRWISLARQENSPN